MVAKCFRDCPKFDQFSHVSLSFLEETRINPSIYSPPSGFIIIFQTELPLFFRRSYWHVSLSSTWNLQISKPLASAKALLMSQTYCRLVEWGPFFLFRAVYKIVIFWRMQKPIINILRFVRTCVQESDVLYGLSGLPMIAFWSICSFLFSFF